ncbi:hypothetical protein EAI_00685 [Harpegnathos saltator]|uniref:Uncharacterized protein n=1 Tax=Harpegnathos saltator TaxID=610380 RepID=E2BT34_HARSA|nr:hypothetical protein EAI_00685 [Harpegnathos saltator]
MDEDEKEILNIFRFRGAKFMVLAIIGVNLPVQGFVISKISVALYAMHNLVREVPIIKRTVIPRICGFVKIHGTNRFLYL